MLETLSGRSLRSAPSSPGPSSPRSPSKHRNKPASVVTLPTEVDSEAIEKFLASKRGEPTVRASWSHGKSVSSAYWDPRGRSIVSTSYDDTIRRKSASMFASNAHLMCLCSMGDEAFLV